MCFLGPVNSCCMSTFTQPSSVKQVILYSSPSQNESKFRKKTLLPLDFTDLSLLITLCVNSLLMSKCLKSIITVSIITIITIINTSSLVFMKTSSKTELLFSRFFSPLCYLGAAYVICSAACCGMKFSWKFSNE